MTIKKAKPWNGQVPFHPTTGNPISCEAYRNNYDWRDNIPFTATKLGDIPPKTTFATCKHKKDNHTMKIRQDDDKRPVKNFAFAYCFSCAAPRPFQLNSGKYSYVAEYECQACGHKTDFLIREYEGKKE